MTKSCGQSLPPDGVVIESDCPAATAGRQVVAAGGTGNGGAGTTAGISTTAVINGNTVTAAGGTGQASGQNGETASSATIDGTNYTGVAGGFPGMG